MAKYFVISVIVIFMLICSGMSTELDLVMSLNYKYLPSGVQALVISQLDIWLNELLQIDINSGLANDFAAPPSTAGKGGLDSYSGA
jgi:hypothetical protein